MKGTGEGTLPKGEEQSRKYLEISGFQLFRACSSVLDFLHGLRPFKAERLFRDPAADEC